MSSSRSRATASRAATARASASAPGFSTTWHEVSKSHPAALTTIIHKSAHPDPESAVSATFNSNVTLTKLNSKLHGDFVEKNGWTVWRVGAPDAVDGLNGSWVYTRPAEGGYLPWQPITWQDCVQRHEQCTGTKVSPRSSWKKRLKRDQAVVDSMLAAIGTDDPMNPFSELQTIQLASTICEQIIKPSLLNTRQTNATQTARRWERVLSSIHTESDLKAATEYLAESIVSEHAEDWLYQHGEDQVYHYPGTTTGTPAQDKSTTTDTTITTPAEATTTGTLDALERILLKTLEESQFLMLASYCAIARMCEDDPKHAELWYTTGGDCSGHRNIAAYASSSQKQLEAADKVNRSSITSRGSAMYTAAANKKVSQRGMAKGKQRKGSTSNISNKGSTSKRYRCGHITLTGDACKHRVSAFTKICPAGHKQTQHT